MKKHLFILLFSILVTVNLNAQAPPPPPSNAGTGGGPVGSPVGAPIDGGLTIMLALAGVYAVKKTSVLKRDCY